MSKRVVVLIAAAAAAVALLVGLSSTSSEGATGPVAVYPSQGTPVASPQTQISFRGAAAGKLTGISVTGSNSGAHTGKLRAHSDGQGASFVPDRPFTPGETVTVKADPPLIGAVNGAVTFTVAVPDPSAEIAPPAPDPGGNPPDAQVFHSIHKIRPPRLRILQRTAAAAHGDLFVGAKAGPGQDGALIYDEHGRLVFFHRVPGGTSALDVRAQRYQGKPVLTWWQGPVLQGEGFGEGLILDDTYKLIRRVRTGNGYKMDLHDFLITPDDKALVMLYSPVKWDLSSIGGPKDGVVLDAVVQEIDIKTGLVTFEWHSVGHIDLSEAYTPLSPNKRQAYDISHLNSVEPEKDGNLLISARNTSALYEVDRKSGNILWRLGGKKSDFAMGPGASFQAQHDARRLPDGTISIFDNGSPPPPPQREARAIVLNVNTGAKTATLVHEYRHANPPIRTLSQGGVQNLPNGDLLVGWGGALPFITEFNKAGQSVFEAQFNPTGDDTYRAYRLPWHATPFRKPDVVATRTKGHTIVYVSWNGATDVSRWQVLTGNSRGSLKPAGTVRYGGFETTIRVHGAPRFVQLRALDRSGKVIGTSSVKRRR